MGCNLVQFRTADSKAFTAARDAWAQVPEFRGTLGNTLLTLSCLETRILHLPDGQSGQSLGRAPGDKELAQITVWKLDRGKITNKSIKETEGSLIYTFNNSPTKVEEICYVSKDTYSKEHSYTLKLGRDSGGTGSLCSTEAQGIPESPEDTEGRTSILVEDGVTETWIGKLLAESDRVRLVMRAKLETWAAPSHSVLRTFIGSSIIPFAIIGTLGRGDARSKDQSQRYCKATESLLGQRPQRERIGWSKRRTSQQGTGGSSNPCGWQ
ncbi:uncharacterized protein LOC130705647 [Balaenoptera acutorostrata]|uniref:Uncharacterized protein LOC130705647 n=1 Tax=Balaenoptera acutorostrata TaxID=9767 RepID=A0ABM3SHF9_BALAC|nr:uncharacterized protein LOC130705647 [Balaenoptera acutorostrata]